jgi:hypothetical protein
MKELDMRAPSMFYSHEKLCTWQYLKRCLYKIAHYLIPCIELCHTLTRREKGNPEEALITSSSISPGNQSSKKIKLLS